jgi:hypothetical protein
MPDSIVAMKNAAAIGAGHSFIIFLGDGFLLLSVLNMPKIVLEVCRIFCATANPTEVMRFFLQVLKGSSPLCGPLLKKSQGSGARKRSHLPVTLRLSILVATRKPAAAGRSEPVKHAPCL